MYVDFFKIHTTLKSIESPEMPEGLQCFAIIKKGADGVCKIRVNVWTGL